jgi:iron complex transport system ATP-binding protein
VAAGERWVILGPNGGGKTTLLSVASMSLWPTRGTVDVLGERYGRTDARELRRRIGVAGSAVEAAMRPDLTPETLIMTARHGAFEPWWHVYDDADRARARALGASLGLAGHLDQPFGTLSAGERRRTTIARALMPDPEILFLDEPMASLDLGARERLLEDLRRLAGARRPAAIVLVTHHLEEIPAGFEHLLVVARGQPVARGSVAEVLDPRVLEAAYGIPVDLSQHGGRWSARMRPQPSGAPAGDGVRPGSIEGTMTP